MWGWLLGSYLALEALEALAKEADAAERTNRAALLEVERELALILKDQPASEWGRYGLDKRKTLARLGIPAGEHPAVEFYAGGRKKR